MSLLATMNRDRLEVKRYAPCDAPVTVVCASFSSTVTSFCVPSSLLLIFRPRE